MNCKEKLKRLLTFLGWTAIDDTMGVDTDGRLRTLPPLDDNLIALVHAKLTGEQWNTYVNELELTMLNDMDQHFPSLKFANIEVGKCILVLKSSVCQKSEALLQALDFWFNINER